MPNITQQSPLHSLHGIGCSSEGGAADEAEAPLHALRILVVTPEAEWMEPRAQALLDAGFRVITRQLYGQGIAYFMRQNPDLVLASWTLDDLGGLGLLRRIRTSSDKPFLLLLNETDDTSSELSEQRLRRLQAYQEGADDVIPGDAPPEEVVARVFAVLRRSPYELTRAGSNDALAAAEGFQVGATTASWQGAVAELTETESQLLRVLLQYRGDVLSKPYLQLLILKRPFVHHDRSIDVHVSNLRRKLDVIGHPSGRIRAVRGYGYRYD